MTDAIRTAAAAPYFGRHRRGLDASRRVLLPSEWRGEDAPNSLTLLLWPAEEPQYLLALSPVRWAALLDNLAQVSLTDERGAEIERLIAANAFPRTLDGYGRLPLPDEAVQALGLGGEVLLVGRMNKFEIWNPDRFAAATAAADRRDALLTLRSIRV